MVFGSLVILYNLSQLHGIGYIIILAEKSIKLFASLTPLCQASSHDIPFSGLRKERFSALVKS